LAERDRRADPEGVAGPVTGVDFVAVPSTDWRRSRAFYVDTLGLSPDRTGQSEFWIGRTCFGIYEPATFGMEFAPQRTAHIAMHVDDVERARADLEERGVRFEGETFDTGVCHMAFFFDPDGNALMLHHRYAPREGQPA
jgi:catechol 2,3-dioxygenase-like lactoylglutathione lyase family enzyme